MPNARSTCPACSTSRDESALIASCIEAHGFYAPLQSSFLGHVGLVLLTCWSVMPTADVGFKARRVNPILS
jgi:hypothetical protein